MIHRLVGVALLATLALALGTSSAQAAAKRVVALEYDSLENLIALGVKPVGAADPNGFKKFVSIALPGGITNVGLRVSPSLERIAKLKPDLIVVPSNRAGKNLKTLRKIAKVLVTTPYPGSTADGAQYNAMVSDFKRLGSAVGRRARANSVLKGMSRAFSRARTRLRKAKRSGIRITIATPGGTASSPAARLFTNNSLSAGIVRRLGLRNAWSATGRRFGFSTVGVEALRKVQNGWLTFVYPAQYAAQIRRFTSQNAYKRLNMVKKKRVRHLAGNTWLFGGPLSARVFAQRLTNALT